MTGAVRSTRREVMKGAALGLGAVLGGFRWPRRALAAEPLRVIADEKWASLHELGDRIWAVVSKPLGGSFDTLCNGGLVAGGERVVAFDCYASPAGAQWLVGRARELTGLPPTDVVLSHHHGDHTRGLAGFATGSHRPQVWTTGAIRDRVAAAGSEGAAVEMLASARLLDEGETTLDLGGRALVLTTHSGHTPSDVAARTESVLFCGDLVWNGFFPNYVDALPDLLGPSVERLLGSGAETLVPGHGPLPDRSALERYAALLREVEAAARAALEAGRTAEEGARDFTLSPPLAEWTRFSPNYYEVAFRAWYRRLS